MSRHTANIRAPGDFGLAVQQARLSLGLSQAELAQELGIPQSTVSQVETGNSTIFLRRLLALAAATGLQFSADWGDDDAAHS